MVVQQQGHKVRAVFTKNWDSDGEDDKWQQKGFSISSNGRRYAKYSPRFVSFSKQYKAMVFKDFVNEYSGRTPNPDVFCNSRKLNLKHF